MNKKLQANSLLLKLASFIFALLFLPLLIVVWLLGVQLSNLLLTQTEALFDSSINQVQRNMEAELSSLRQIAQGYAFDPRLINYMGLRYDQPNRIEMQFEAHTYFQDLLQFPSFTGLPVTRVILFTENPTLWVSGRYLFSFRFLSEAAISSLYGESSANWWSAPGSLMGNGTYPQVAAFSGAESSIFYCRQLRMAPGKPRAFVSLQMPLSALTQYLTVLPGNSYILSDRGDMLGSVLSEPMESIPLATVLQREQHGGDRFFLQDQGHNNLITITKLSNGWSLLHELPYDRLLSETQLVRGIAIGLALLMGALCFLLIYAMWRTVVRRMQQILGKINHIQSGDFAGALALGSPVVRNPDELQLLSNRLDEMTVELRELIDENYRLGVSRKESELRALQAQINPHFLYNTLSTIKWMTQTHSSESIQEIVDAMARFYRISLSKGRDIITIDEELKCTHAYLSIQRYRTMGQIQAHFDVDDELLDTLIPKLTLQPLVENSIIHGPIEQQPMALIIRVRREDAHLLIEVADDGRGMSEADADVLLNEQKPTISNAGYGLYNVHQRISLYYGSAAALSVRSALGEGTAITIRIPLASLRMSDGERYGHSF